jgi:hypothetical protein
MESEDGWSENDHKSIKNSDALFVPHLLIFFFAYSDFYVC